MTDFQTLCDLKELSLEIIKQQQTLSLAEIKFKQTKELIMQKQKFQLINLNKEDKINESFVY